MKLGARTAKLIQEQLAPAVGMKFTPDPQKIAQFDRPKVSQETTLGTNRRFSATKSKPKKSHGAP
jgi:hypothetical protein